MNDTLVMVLAVVVTGFVVALLWELRQTVREARQALAVATQWLPAIAKEVHDTVGRIDSVTSRIEQGVNRASEFVKPAASVSRWFHESNGGGTAVKSLLVGVGLRMVSELTKRAFNRLAERHEEEAA